MAKAEDLVFTGEVFECKYCNSKNQLRVHVRPYGVAVLDGNICEHTKNVRLGERINKLDALCFLDIEKKEAEINLSKENDEARRKNIEAFIRQVENAIYKLSHPRFTGKQCAA